jgi:predicted glycoside hydrolase/deacetylase ChbG (UPF0249 family)
MFSGESFSASRMKYLILSADDFGMNEAVSRGILTAASQGSLRATAAMANCAFFESALSELDASGESLDVGIHLNLTWGIPLSHPSLIPSIVDDEDRLLTRGALLQRSLLHRISEDEVYEEFRAQCARLALIRGRITHLDGHHHIHVYPVVRRAAERVAHEFGISYVRAPREGLWSPWYWGMGRRLGMSLLRSSGKPYWRKRGFCTPDFFGGFALGCGPAFRERWIGTLSRIREGVTEIMVHPGYSSGDNDTYDEGRRDELEWLVSGELEEAAGARGILFTSFAELADRM